MYLNCPRAIPLQYVQNHHEKESRVKIAVKERADQPAHPHRHNNTFYARYLDSILYLYNRICNHWLAMAAQQVGLTVSVMRQSACLVINPITVDGYATLFNCTPVDRASDSMMAPT